MNRSRPRTSADDAQELVAEAHRGGHQAQRHEGRGEEAQEHARARERLVVDERAGRQQAPVLGREDGQGAGIVHREGSQGSVTAPRGRRPRVLHRGGRDRAVVHRRLQAAGRVPAACRNRSSTMSLGGPWTRRRPRADGAGGGSGATSCGAAPGSRGRGSRRRRRSPACRGWPPEGLRSGVPYRSCCAGLLIRAIGCVLIRHHDN